MTKDKNIKTVVPALRFPEFRDAEGWEVRAFSNYIRLYRGSSPRPIQQYLTQNDDGVNWIKIGDTKYARKFIIDTVEEKITNKGAQKSRQVYTGELILANSMSFGKTYLLGIDGCIYDGWFVLREYENYFLKSFLLQLLNSEYLQNQYEKLSAGGIVQNISSDIVYQTILPKTSILEQQKIADCLGCLDDLISAVADKIEALKEHKKGLMQQLFPAEGKTTPALRFPEFQNVGEWKLSSIKKCNIDAFTGYAFKGNEILEDCDGTPLMRGINITEGVVRHNNDIDRFYNGEDYTLGKYRLLCNDLVIAMDGSKVGRNFALINKQDEGSLLVQRVARLRSNSADFIMFLYQQIGSDRFKTYVDRINTSSGIPHISLKQIEDFEIWTTRNDKEIEMVTNCLSSIDELISTETDKLEQLEAHKKGLMQQLFPTLNE